MGEKPNDFNHWYTMLILIGLTLIGPMSFDIYTPAIPSVAKSLHSSIQSVQYTLSLFALGFAFGLITLVPSSDRFGRVPILKIGMIIYTLSSLIALFTPNMTILFIARILQGYGSSIGPVLARAIINDTHELKQAAHKTALIVIFLLIGPAIGPIIGSYITHFYSWRAIFIAMIIYAIFLNIGVFFFLEETIQKKHLKATKLRWISKNIILFSKSRHFIMGTICCITAFAGHFTIAAGVPFVYMVLYHLPVKWFGWIFALSVTGFIIGSYISRWLIKYMQLTSIIRMGSIISLFASLVLLFIYFMFGMQLWILVIGFWIFYLGCGLIFSNAVTIAVNIFSHVAGLANAVNSFIYWIAGMLAGTALSLMQAYSPLSLISILFIMAFISAIFSFFIPEN